MLNIITIGIFETVTLVMLGGGVILFLGILALAVRCMRKVEPGTVGVRTGLGGIKAVSYTHQTLPTSDLV